MGIILSNKKKNKPKIENQSKTTPPTPLGARMVAIFDYRDAGKGEINFRKGDVFVVQENFRDFENDWIMGEKVGTREKGLIPLNYLVEDQSLEKNDWFHGPIPRKDCQKLLQKEGREGVYLVRNSEGRPGEYSLSLLANEITNEIKHYRLKNPKPTVWYISVTQNFHSLQELLVYYSKSSGLCCKLTKPCPKPLVNHPVVDKWEIDPSNIEFLERLGSGFFGEVWKGILNKKTKIAVKMLKNGVAEKEKFLEEAAIMKKLRHPKLVRLYAVCTLKEPMYIVTELMAKGSLQQMLKKDKGDQIKWKEMLEFAAQIASGMQYIESRNYIHRDLATRNILVDEYNLVKIGDFGLAKAMRNEQIYMAKESSKFPVKWTAVEALTRQIFTIKSDVWSFGIVLVELFIYGTTPYPGKTNSEIQNLITTSNYRHPRPDNCPDEMYDLMLKCWFKDPANRPTFEFLYSTLDDFFVATQAQYAE